MNPTDVPLASLPDIVFFDGVCGLCNHTVNFLMSRDRGRRLRFAPLQGKTAELLLEQPLRVNLDTLVFRYRGGNFVRSAAVVRFLWVLGGIWKLFAVLLWLIPLPLRDLGYRLVAKSRYRLFRKSDACRMPTPEERGRILE